MKKLALHWQILIGMVLGIVAGLIFSNLGWGKEFVQDWIKPFGTIFIKLLKLIAIPLILASLIKGIADLQDIAKFSSIGLKTIGIYIGTTLIAISIGLIAVNLIQPGNHVTDSTLSELSASYADAAATKVTKAQSQMQQGPLQFIVDMVPDNIFGAAAENRNMLQVIFFAVLFGISLLLVEQKKSQALKDVITGINDTILRMVDLIMLIAPYAVFALLASLIVETSNPDLFKALASYALTVVLGLSIMLIFYLTVVKLYTGKTPKYFLNGIAPAQLLAFSTSSSAATLPVTMERVEEHLGVDSEITSFVCPVGATINMDGTSLYQAVAAVFICQALNFDLSFSDQLTIVLTATLASIGSAAVPGAGMVMLVIVLESIGFPKDLYMIGLALIFAVDRPLDMCRTTINVSGDAAVSMIVAKSENKLHEPHPRNISDNYEF